MRWVTLLGNIKPECYSLVNVSRRISKLLILNLAVAKHLQCF